MERFANAERCLPSTDDGGGSDRLHYCSGIPPLRSLITVLCSAASTLPFVEHVQEYGHTQACQQMNQ
jgi:hypothetical protein